VVLLLDSDHPEDYAGLEMVFINMDRSLVPWFIESISITDDRALVKLEDISSPEQAQQLLKRDIYLPTGQLREKAGNDFYYHDVAGYAVYDSKHGEIGILQEVLEGAAQDIFRIGSGKREILVPVADAMIREVDHEKGILYLDTPEGLIDLYLE
jgi:16S rRNA processing protein RimM